MVFGNYRSTKVKVGKIAEFKLSRLTPHDRYTLLSSNVYKIPIDIYEY